MAEADKDPQYWYRIFNKVFGSPEGKKALLFLLNSSGLLDAPQTYDPNEGQCLAYRKLVVLEILQIMRVSPIDLIVDGESAESSLSERMGEVNE